MGLARVIRLVFFIKANFVKCLKNLTLN